MPRATLQRVLMKQEADLSRVETFLRTELKKADEAMQGRLEDQKTRNVNLTIENATLTAQLATLKKKDKPQEVFCSVNRCFCKMIALNQASDVSSPHSIKKRKRSVSSVHLHHVFVILLDLL